MSGAHNKGKGKAIAWLRDHADHTGVRCLRWPFYCDNHGNGILGHEGKMRKAARMICEMAHGAPPTPGHECAHSCGNGHMGCVNPTHLSWKTRAENQRDRRKHGTHGKPGCDGRNKLTIEQIKEIRAAPKPVNKADLARKYGCTPSNIAKILNGIGWQEGKRHLSPLPADIPAKVRALQGRQRVADTAKQFGISPGSVYRIQRGETPKSVYLRSR